MAPGGPLKGKRRDAASTEPCCPVRRARLQTMVDASDGAPYNSEVQAGDSALAAAAERLARAVSRLDLAV